MAGSFTTGTTETRRRRVEWPSIALSVGVYGGFVVLTWFAARLPVGLFLALGAPLLALQASLQHEFIHGHPTPWRRLNRALGFVPLNLWLPFESYRMTHLVHHRDERLTDPFDDPESFYWTPEGWAGLGPLGRAFVRVHSTLAGRVLFGPAWTIGRYLRGEARSLIAGDAIARGIWVPHGLAMVLLAIWIVGVCAIPATLYCVTVYAATAILLLRSFAEHRALQGVFERTAVVENAPILGFLFLYNNLHAAHHERPLVPWYELPGWYRRNRDRLVARNGGLVYDGYRDVARRFLLTPHDTPVHPLQAQGREGGPAPATHSPSLANIPRARRPVQAPRVARPLLTRARERAALTKFFGRAANPASVEARTVP